MFMVNLPVFEIITILFFYNFFRWLFRFGIMVLIAKVLSSLKEKASQSLNELKGSLKGKGENDV